MLSSPIIVNALLQICNKIKTYQYTINFATDLFEDEQIIWFKVLNNAGSRVSIIQMRFSKLKAHGIDVYMQYKHLYCDKIYGKMHVYMVIYRCKDKNTTQDTLVELVGSPVAPLWCK